MKLNVRLITGGHARCKTWATATLAAHTDYVRSVAWAPHDPNVLASGSNDRTVKVWDLAAAKEAGHPALPAPPTFLMCLDSLAPSNDPGVLKQLGVDIGRILHGEQRFKYGKPIYAGDEITFELPGPGVADIRIEGTGFGVG